MSFNAVRYSVPHELVESRVWVRQQGEQVIVTTEGDTGPREVARHTVSTPGNPRIAAEHYPQRPETQQRAPQPVNAEEAAFLTLGEGAAQWLIEAAAAGARRIRPKMAEAVALAKLHGAEAVDHALGTAALAGRFADGDLTSILEHQRHGPPRPPTPRSEQHTLQPGTSAWARFGHQAGAA